MAKNCHTCKWLEWVDGEESDPAGWSCDKRQNAVSSGAAERAVLKMLACEDYRNRYKSCYEAQVKENDRG